MVIEHRKVDDQKKSCEEGLDIGIPCGVIAVVEKSYRDYTMLDPADLLPCID
jgi:hypothetical protein